MRNLLERNRERPLPSDSGRGEAGRNEASSLQVPFVLFSTDQAAQVEVQFSDDMQDVFMDFADHAIHLSDEKMLLRMIGLGKEWPKSMSVSPLARA